MSIAIYTLNEKQSNKWKAVLQEELPEAKIEVYPNIEDFGSVLFLVCWKPEAGLLDKFPNLVAIQSLGAGVDHIFNFHTVDSKIQVSKVVDPQLKQDMLEHVLAIVMSDMKNLKGYSLDQEDKTWQPKRYRRIKDTSIGLLGLGKIGGYIAKQFSNLGFNTSGWSLSKRSIENVTTFNGKEGYKDLISSVDYVVNILPLTDKTDGIIDKDFFALMKKDAYFINVGRGKHVVEKDLLHILNDEKVRGAALDVFIEEPLPKNNLLWNHPKIMITPHIASLTDISSVYPQVAENYRRISSGKEVRNKVNVEKGY